MSNAYQKFGSHGNMSTPPCSSLHSAPYALPPFQPVYSSQKSKARQCMVHSLDDRTAPLVCGSQKTKGRQCAIHTLNDYNVILVCSSQKTKTRQCALHTPDNCAVSCAGQPQYIQHVSVQRQLNTFKERPPQDATSLYISKTFAAGYVTQTMLLTGPSAQHLPYSRVSKSWRD